MYRVGVRTMNRTLHSRMTVSFGAICHAYPQLGFANIRTCGQVYDKSIQFFIVDLLKFKNFANSWKTFLKEQTLYLYMRHYGGRDCRVQIYKTQREYIK